MHKNKKEDANMIGSKDLYKTIYIIYNHCDNEDIKFPNKAGICRYDFGLPYVEEKTLTEQDFNTNM